MNKAPLPVSNLVKRTILKISILWMKQNVQVSNLVKRTILKIQEHSFQSPL